MRVTVGAQTLEDCAEAAVADVDASVAQDVAQGFAVETGQTCGDLAGDGHEVLIARRGSGSHGRRPAGGGLVQQEADVQQVPDRTRAVRTNETLVSPGPRPRKTRAGICARPRRSSRSVRIPSLLTLLAHGPQRRSAGNGQCSECAPRCVHGRAHRTGPCSAGRRASPADLRGGRVVRPVVGVHPRRTPPPRCIVYAAADGMRLAYPVPRPDQPAFPELGPRWPLEWDGRLGGAITLADPATGLVRTFSHPEGTGATHTVDLPIESIEDRTGHRIDFERTGDGIPLAVHHCGGYRLDIETSGARVTALRLADSSWSATATTPTATSPRSSTPPARMFG